MEQENYKTKVKINTVREKNRLYDRLQAQTAHQIELLDQLLTQYEAKPAPDIRRSLLAKAAVIGAYIKRRGNLMFIGEKSNVTDTAELLWSSFFVTLLAKKYHYSIMQLPSLHVG